MDGRGNQPRTTRSDKCHAASETPDYESLSAHTRALGISTISLLEDFRETGRTTMGYVDEDGHVLDPHWDSTTHRLVADVVLRESAETLPAEPKRRVLH